MALALLLITVLSIFFPHTEPAPSSQKTQEKNLKILKSVQKHDLVTCYINGTARSAILIEQNYDYGYQFLGRVLAKNELRDGQIIPYSAFTNCDITVQRDDTNGVMPQFPAAIGRIILYGLNPPPVK